jgi:hypothetical protein
MTAGNKLLSLTMMVMTWTVVSSTSVYYRPDVGTHLKKNIRGSKLRGESGTKRDQYRRIAHGPLHHGHDSSHYSGCLSLTDEELEYYWIFSGPAPNCSYVHTCSDESCDDDDAGDGEDGGSGDDEDE